MSLFRTVFGVGGAIAGGILAGDAAREQNRNIERNARHAQRAINTNISRARFSFFDNQRIATKRYQQSVGNASARIFAGGRSGHSLNRLLADADNDFFADDLARKRALSQTIENFETQKRNIVRQANASTVNTAIAGIGGAIQGFNTGWGVGGSIESAVGSIQDAAFLSDLNDNLAATPGDLNLQAQAAAVSGGVPVSLLRSNPTLATAPFATSLQTQSVGQSLLNNSLIGAQQLQSFATDRALSSQFRLGGLLR